MFPLIVSGAVVLQSIVVIPVQGLNTSPILFDGCVRTVQLVWPGMKGTEYTENRANSDQPYGSHQSLTWYSVSKPRFELYDEIGFQPVIDGIFLLLSQ